MLSFKVSPTLSVWLLLTVVVAAAAQNASVITPNASSVLATNQTAGWIAANSSTKIQATTFPTMKPTTVDRCFGKKIWNDDLIVRECTTIACAGNIFSKFEEYMKCNDKKDDDRVSTIAKATLDYAEAVAESYVKSQPSSVLANGSVSFTTNLFFVEVGFLNRQRSDLRQFSTIPDFSKSPASAYRGEKDKFRFSMITLNPGVTAYYILLLRNLISTTQPIQFKDEKPAAAEELVKQKRYSWPTRTGKWVLNSQIAQIGFSPRPSSMSEPIEVTFWHKVHIKRKNHECVVYPGSLNNEYSSWTREGCYRTYTDRQKTICRCNYQGTVAVVSEIDEEIVTTSGFSRTFFTQVAMAVSAFMLLGLLMSIIYPVYKGYLHLMRVRIYFFHDIACFMVYLSFLLGVIVSDNRKYTDTMSGCIHYFQTAVISWILVEGVHNYQSFNPVYDAEVTSPTFFYNTIGWGIPAAFSGACAGYPYDLTVLAEFSWMKVSGAGLLYFVIGPLFSVLAITLSYALIFYELRSYIGGKYDYPYRRAIEYFKRSCLLMIVAFLAWYSGIMARNNPDKLSFSFLFLAMYGTQGCAIIYMHFLKNTEIIEYRESMKATNDGSHTARTEEDNISMMSSVNLSQSDFKSQASLRSGAGRRSKQSRPKTAESRDDTTEEEGSRRSSDISSSSENDDSSSSSAEDDVDEQQSQRYSYGAYAESSRPVSATTKGSMQAWTEEGEEVPDGSSNEEGAVEEDSIITNREKRHHSVTIEDESLQGSSYGNGEEVNRILETQETGDDGESQENDRSELEGDEDTVGKGVDESNDEENAQESAVNELHGEESHEGFNANELDGEDQGNEANESIDEGGVKDNNKESLIEENEQGNDVNDPYGNDMQEDSSGSAEGIVEGQEIPNPASGDSADRSKDVDLGYNEHGDESTA